jgi:type III secretion apparatus needle protein
MDFNSILSQMAQGASLAGTRAEDAISGGDMANPTMWLEVQRALGHYSTLISAQSSMIKKVDDTLSGIIAKI